MTPLAIALNALVAKPGETFDAFDLAKARALLGAYNARYLARFSAAKVLAAEIEFRFPLTNPETEGRSQSFDEAGKFDAVIEEGGRIKLVEHKTTSDAIDPASDYWDRLAIDTQISKYLLGAQFAGYVAESVIYDAIRKPLLYPGSIPELDGVGMKIVEDLAGARIYTKTGTPRQTGDTEKGWKVRARPETPEEYEARLLADFTARPEFYFGQREVARLESQTLEYMADAWASSQQVLYFRRRGLWPRNPSACMQFGRCEYFDLCTGRATIDGVAYRRHEKRHAELSEALQAGETDERQLLTNSRLSCLRTCARKHALKYEQQIERVGDEAAALRFGSLFHRALEAWFLAIKAAQNPS